MSHSPAVALAEKASLAEGAIWDARTKRLLWVDIPARRVSSFDPIARQNQSTLLASLVSAIVPTEGDDLLVALREGIGRFDPRAGSVRDVVAPPGHDPGTMRFNDGKCDPAGRFVVGTMSLAGAKGAAALYSFSENCFRTLLPGVSMSNGLVWSADGCRMYYVDTPTRQIAAFDYDLATGTLRNRTTAVEIPESLGFPDGLTIDQDGMLWLALWGGSSVTRWDPRTGRLLERQMLPVSQVTSCALGGTDLKTLFVTTARDGLSTTQLASEPLAGAIFELTVDVPGVPSARFQG